MGSTNVSMSVLYWKLTQSLSKSYPGVCLHTKFLLVARYCSFEAFYSFAAHGTFCLRVPIFHSSWEESTLICLLLDVLDGRWLYSIVLSAGMATRSLTILKRRTSLCSFLLSFSGCNQIWLHFELHPLQCWPQFQNKSKKVHYLLYMIQLQSVMHMCGLGHNLCHQVYHR